MIKQGYTVVIIVLFIGINVFSSAAGKIAENPFMPTPNGTILYVGGSGPGNYSRIQDAIDDAEDGDTVFVYDDSSPYKENIILHKSISLIGENTETTIVNGKGELDVIDVQAVNAQITGFTLRNADGGIYGSLNHSVISDNIIECYQFGIGILYSSHNVISDNRISGGYEVGLAVCYDSVGNVISGNTIAAGSIGGVYLVDASRGTIVGNTIQGNTEFGLELYWSFFNVIKENNFILNTRHAYFENSVLNFWMRNYWDDWDGSGSYVIYGENALPWDLNTTFEWKNFDWRPMAEPNGFY
jgi:parallel beta-helix repeat protein